VRRTGNRFDLTAAILIAAGATSHFLVASPLAALFDPLGAELLLPVAGLAVLAWSGWKTGRVGIRRSVLALAGAATLSIGVRDRLAHRRIQVGFTNGEVRLAGTLFLPRDGAPHPAAVLVHGSSPGTRGVFRPIANALGERGVAALAYDKRGFGRSGGTLPYTYRQLAGDAAAAVRYLRRRPEIDSSAVGLVGFSEGGWTAPLAASRLADPAFLVVVSGGGLSPAEQELWEMRTRLDGKGFGPEATTRALRLQGRLNRFHRTGRDADRTMAAIRRAESEPWFEAAFELAPEDVPGSLDSIEYEHDPTELDFDALPVIARLRAPELFIFGGRDRLVPPRRSALQIRAAARRAGRREPEIVFFPGANHLILAGSLGAALPLARFAPGYLDTLGVWIHRSVSE